MPDEKAQLAARKKMVERQLRPRGIKRQDILDAFLSVPRHRFVPAEHQRSAYEDRPLPIGASQTISQPYVVALMLQELDPRPTQRVLDVGAGSGYQTALLGGLVAQVYAVERLDSLRRRAAAELKSLDITNVTLSTRDGSLGWPEEAPFDRIICGAGAPEGPQAWLDQLVDGGRIVVPVGGSTEQVLVAVDKDGGRIERREICGVRFVKLIGRDGWDDH